MPSRTNNYSPIWPPENEAPHGALPLWGMTPFGDGLGSGLPYRRQLAGIKFITYTWALDVYANPLQHKETP